MTVAELRPAVIHARTTFANPYLTCDRCHTWVTAWHDPTACGCDATWWNEPCPHTAGLENLCTTWTPAGGCRCVAELGWISHSEPPAEVLR